MNLDLAVDEFIDHPVERVWQAITQRGALETWLMANDFEPRVGHRFRLRGDPKPPWRGVVDCEVLELSPPHLMRWSWLAEEHGEPTTVTFELSAARGGTRLEIRHQGTMDPRLAERTRSAWPRKLEALKEELESQKSG